MCEAVANKMQYLLVFCCIQERLTDVVIEGFIHLQQFHLCEISCGLSGMGQYRLRPEFPACHAMPVLTTFVVDPQHIVSTLQAPAAEVQCVSYMNTSQTF